MMATMAAEIQRIAVPSLLGRQLHFLARYDRQKAKAIRRTETQRRYGRIAVNHAELPARPAAATKGSIGKQQLEAATALASAAVLARIVPRPDWRSLLGTAILSAVGEFPNGLSNEGYTWYALLRTAATIRTAANS
jgi:hypothetical protein